jgi:hypothetical protein
MHSSTQLRSTMQTSLRKAHPAFDSRGSVLLVSLIFAAAIGIALGSYLQLGRVTLEIANRAYYSNVAVNLAESGLEEGMWAINKSDWTGWQTKTGGLVKEVTGYKYDGNVTGLVRILAADTASTSPNIVAHAVITPPRGQPIEKWLRVTLSGSPGRERKIVARRKFRFSGGNGEVLAYDSRDGEPGGSNLYDDVTVTSLSLDPDTFELNNSIIRGYVAVGTPNNKGLTYNSRMIIGKFGDSQGTIRWDRVTHDAKMNLPDADAPSTGTAIGAINDSHTISSSGTYRLSGIDLSGSETLTIAPGVNAELVITATTGTAVKTSGNAEIVVPTNSSLKIYTEADVQISGNGVANSGKPINFELIGTRPKTHATQQSISVNGNGTLRGVIYAPNGNITINGGGSNKGDTGDIYGAAVGYDVTLHGNAKLYWDKALAAQSAKTVLRVAEWSELTTAGQRGAYLDKFK